MQRIKDKTISSFPSYFIYFRSMLEMIDAWFKGKQVQDLGCLAFISGMIRFLKNVSIHCLSHTHFSRPKMVVCQWKNVSTMDKQTGQIINLFDFCQPITDVYCGHLTNERAQFLQHPIYEPSCLLVHGFYWDKIIQK